MKNLPFLLFILLALPSSAQHTSIITEDFNNDGVVELLKCTYDIEDTFGGANCELRDEKNKKKFTLSNYGCFCAIKKRVVVDPELRRKENQHFFYRLKNEILPQFKSTPDQSLLWIINSSLNTQKPQENQFFDLVFNPKTAWRHEEPELPYTYYIEMGVKTLSKLLPEDETSSSSTTSDQRDFLIYYGDSHFSTENNKKKDFTPIVKNESYEILKTAHGILVKKGRTYKWLFVTDRESNASPQKLRWASIDEVFLHDDAVIFKQRLTPDYKYHVYIIDIETGLGGRLKIDFDSLQKKDIEISDLKVEERFSIKKSTLIVGNKSHKIKFPLTEIKQELEILTKGN